MIDASSKCGHVSELLKNSFDTKCMDKSQSMVDYHKFKYNDHRIIQGELDNQGVLRSNSFTHACILHYDIYDYPNLDDIMINMSNILIEKGTLFIHVLNSMKHIQNYYSDTRDLLNGNFVYASNLTHKKGSEYTLIEKIRNENSNKERKNMVSKTFYSNDHIVYIANTFGFEHIANESLSDHDMLLVFKKTN